MKFLISVLFLSISVFLLIFAKQFFVEINQSNLQRRNNRFSNWTLKDDQKNLFWFLQISDIHISKFKDSSRVDDFRVFCSKVVDVVKPRVVIASGDLTDAKDSILGSEQYVEEWSAYRKSLVDTGILNKTTWLDIRGNHDNFNVQYLHSSSDLFRNYSAQGKYHKRSYLHQVNVDGVKYNFLGLDASVEPGTKRPYNFIGMIPTDELYRIEKLINDSPGNYTIWFAHYPTSTIMTSPGAPHIRKFIGQHDDSSIFVAGHLHTLGGMLFQMYSLQPEGFLELELGDFMKNRLFRIGVFDHGLFSFADIKMGTWPVAIITNPKNILFNNLFKEDLILQRDSTHIRIVAFSISEITRCKIRINDREWQKCDKQSENFFTVPWHSDLYSHGKHKIEVLVGDKAGRIFNREQFFALDGSRSQFHFLARFVLMSDITTVFQVAFLMAFTLCLMPLIVFKSWQLLIKHGRLRRPRVASNCWRNFIQKYLVFASVDRVFCLVLFWLLFTALGPWSFHEVLDGHIGYYFVWGTFVKGLFVPGTLNWWYGFHQLMFFQLPLTIIIAGVTHRRFIKFLKKHHDNSTTQYEDTLMQGLRKNLPFLALLTAELLLAIFYLIQNGIIAFVIAPMRVWGLFLSIYLFYQAHWKISDQDFKQSALICAPDSKLATS